MQLIKKLYPVLCFVFVLICFLVSGHAHAQAGRGYLVFQHSELQHLAPNYVPTQQVSSGKVACTLARSEYKSLQLGVYAQTMDLKNIRVSVTSDLPATIHHRIEPATRNKLIADGEMSDWYASEWYLQEGDTFTSLAKGQSVNFWITFHADSKTSTGQHKGKIHIQAEGQAATELDLWVQVRPFKLAAPRIPFGMYYRPDMLPGTRFGGWAVSNKVTSAIYRDMTAHSQNSVTFYGGGDFSQLPPRASRLFNDMKLAQQAGLVHADVPCMMTQANIEAASPYPNALSQAQLHKAAAWLKTQQSEQGWPELLVYGWDEPPYPAPFLRERYLPLREVRLRLVTALNATATFGHGDVFDVWVTIGGEITPQMRAEAKRLGAEQWTYSYRIWREAFKPLRQRYYAGFYTWAHQLSGNFVWAYAHGHHGHAWFEPDSETPMPVTAWEARREGVDDYRYLQMVEDLVAINVNNPAAIKAKAWLDALRARLLPIDPHLAESGKPLTDQEYESIRVTAATFIVKLGPLPTTPSPTPVTHLKDEAATFRNKTVTQCIAGLHSDNVSTQRAAAWALFEMQAAAAPAATALAAVLDNPEVRFPALRALEAIGAGAYPAVNKVVKLLDDNDEFVRLGAAYALAGMARAPSWDNEVSGYSPDDVPQHAAMLVKPLCRALRDESAPIIMAASMGLFFCGEAASPALSDAIIVFDNKELAKRDGGNAREGGLRAMAGMGAKASDALPRLIKAYDASKGGDIIVTRTLAAIGPAASSAVTVLEKYNNQKNTKLADTSYALFCIRGDQADLKTLAQVLVSKDHLYADRKAAARYLIALGGKAAPVAGIIRENLSNLDNIIRIKTHIEASFFQRVEQKAPALRLLQR